MSSVENDWKWSIRQLDRVKTALDKTEGGKTKCVHQNTLTPRTMSTRVKMDENQTKHRTLTHRDVSCVPKKKCGNVQERKMRFNTFIYATLAIHWTLCHRYLVFRAWFNSRIYSLNRSTLHVIFIRSLSPMCLCVFVYSFSFLLVTLNKNECAWKKKEIKQQPKPWMKHDDKRT